MIQVLSALLTPVIAIVTTYIAIQQYRSSARKYRLELFDRRYIVFAAVRDFILAVIRQATVTTEEIFELNAKTRDAFFLFDDSVEKYVDDLRSKGAHLRYINERLGDMSLGVGEERSRLAEEDAELLNWFSSQFSGSKQVFKKFMRVA
jgi:hypothetical protein